MRTAVQTNCHYGGEYLRYIVDSNKRVESLHEISSVEVTQLDQREDPCVSAHEADFNKCVQDFVDSLLNCTLPWRPQRLLPQCSGKRAEYDLFMNLTSTILQSDEETLSELTGCEPSCTRSDYSSKFVSNVVLPDDDGEKDNVLILKLYYARNRVTVRRQYYTYTLEHLIADLGGCLGLLLGYSLLGFYDTCVSLSQCKSKIKCTSD